MSRQRPRHATISRRAYGPTGTRWVATHALARTCVTAAVAAALAVLTGRPDLIILGFPFAVVTLWSVLARPRTEPAATLTLLHRELYEGSAGTLRVTGTDLEGVETLGLHVAPRDGIQLDPPDGEIELPVAGMSSASADVAVRPMRWGRHPVGPMVARFLSAWDAYSLGPVEAQSFPLHALPAPTPYESRSQMPDPKGMVGMHTSRLKGPGLEFSDIRPFVSGDRLKHIHWPVTARTGRLHVTTGYAEQDAEIMLLVDAQHDLGDSGGVEGAPNSLDVTVRAAAGLAEHYLSLGDRVGVQVIGSQGISFVRPAAGRLQMRRVLDVLARVAPGSRPAPRGRAVQPRVSSHALVVLLSTLMAPGILDLAVALSRTGRTVVVVDVIGEHPPEYDGERALAWRLRSMQRERELAAASHVGVTVVPWRGTGTLDPVLRQAARRRPTRLGGAR